MRSVKWFIVSLVIFCCFLVGIGIFALWPNSDLIEKAFGQNNPRVVIVGDVDKMSPGLKDQMPPGFTKRPFREWSPEIDTEDAIIEFGPLDEPRVMFTIEDDTENVDELMEWAKDHGKEEVYLVYPPPIDPDAKFVPDLEPVDRLFSSAASTIDWFIEGLRDPITSAYANTVPPYTCSGGASTPANYTYAICSSTPGLCYFYVQFTYASKTCHTDAYWQHERPNVFLHNWSSSKGWRDAMNHLNGYPNTYTAGFIGQLTELRARIYNSTSVAAQASPCTESTVCGCASSGTFMAGLSPPPYISNKRNVWIAATTNCNLNDWSTIRHEVAHTFGFGHCEMGTNLYHLNEAIEGIGRAFGAFSPSGVTCPPGYEACNYVFEPFPGIIDFCVPNPPSYPFIKDWRYY